MRLVLCLTAFFLAVPAFSQEAKKEAPKKPPLKIIPGKVIVPTDAMRRIWGELVSVDLKTRTGTFRNEGNDEIMPFIVLPYAELLHHAAFGDLHDYRIGERAIFRMHENDEGKWVWLTYIQDEMNFLNGHKEYYWVDRLDPSKGEIEISHYQSDMTPRAKGVIIETDKETRFWKAGQPAKFADIKVGDKLRTQTHGMGKGKRRVAWEVFLDDASLEAFQKKQQAVHRQRMLDEGMPGYIDEVKDGEVRLTLFQQARETAKDIKAKRTVRVAVAGVDRKAGTAVEATVKEIKAAGNLHVLTVTLKDAPPPTFAPAAVARIWVAEK